jgi:uncharacterized protein
MNIGSISAIYRYPVKSMIGEEVETARAGARGIVGDRAFAIADPETGKIASAKNPSKWPSLFKFRAIYAGEVPDMGPLPPAQITLPDGREIFSDDQEIESLLSATLEKPVRFLRAAPPASTLEEYWPDIEGLARRDEVTDEAMPAETFFDVGIVHIITSGTLRSLAARYPQGRFDVRRFRPNMIIDTPDELGEFPEHDWDGKTLILGEAKLKITGPCFRCVMTTLAQDDLPRDNGILRTAALGNQARVGAYASVIQPGTFRRGDSVSLE